MVITAHNLYFGRDVARTELGCVTKTQYSFDQTRHSSGHESWVGCWGLCGINHRWAVGFTVKFAVLFKGLVYAGALYLLYMGVKALMSKGNPFKADTDSKQPTSYYAAARDGFSIAFLNPKLAVFFAALFSQFITPERMNFSSGALMAGTVLAIDTIWYIIVAGLVHGTRERFALAEKGPLIDKIAGVVFIALSIRVVTL